MKKIAVIGAGKTGRGFVGRLLAEAGAEILFIDREERLVQDLNRQRQFKVHFFGEGRPAVTVSNYTAHTWTTADLSQVELIFVSVCGPNLADVGAELKQRLPAGKHYIITCENAVHPAETLSKAIGLPDAAVSEATVFCTTVEGDGLDIRSEDYPYLQFDADRLQGYCPEVEAVRPVKEFGNFLMRKLFTYNAASCIIAYLGWYYGYEDYGAAANDPRIQAIMDQNYDVTNRVLCAEFGYDPEEQAEFAALSKKKFCDTAIADTVARNAREPQRKFGPGERVIGPMKVIAKYGESTAALEMTAAAMLLYDNKGEDAWRAIRESHTPAQILQEIAGLAPDDPLTGRILARYEKMRKTRRAGSLTGLEEIVRQKQSLNGWWDYRIGEGELGKKQVPYSARPVGVSTCERSFDRHGTAPRAFLVFEGITYAAKVTLNGVLLGEMLPYCEYRFEITQLLRETGNRLSVEIRDIDPVFGPTDGWENYSGIIRNVWVEYAPASLLSDAVWSTTFSGNYRTAHCRVQTAADLTIKGLTCRAVLEDSTNRIVGEASGKPGEALTFEVEEPALWSPDSPTLYTLRCLLLDGDKIVDLRAEKVGFKDLKVSGKRFFLNGAPIFLLGVNRHDLYGDSGHTLTEEEMRRDMTMIKQTGVNYVRLVHYPHNKRILELADELGLMVSEEPGLWWADMKNPEICAGALEVLRRTVRRDRNHASIAFWLSFNECVFTFEFLRDSAEVCRREDPYHMVSGANCMDLDMTKENFPKCGFDFYTMHPYAPTVDRLIESANTLTEMPLLFTEWGGYYCAGNERLFREYIRVILELWRNPDTKPVAAGAVFWCWAEMNEFCRGNPGCQDGVLQEGLVDRFRNPTENLRIFTEAFAQLKLPPRKPDARMDEICPLQESGHFAPLDLTGLAAENDSAWEEMLRVTPRQTPVSTARRDCAASITAPACPSVFPKSATCPCSCCSARWFSRSPWSCRSAKGRRRSTSSGTSACPTGSRLAAATVNRSSPVPSATPTAPAKALPWKTAATSPLPQGSTDPPASTLSPPGAGVFSGSVISTIGSSMWSTPVVCPSIPQGPLLRCASHA